ncbi:hypothetical protein AB0O47_40320 [Streptomyces noursei]|uniref:hypothetical protein n=1 Tax=Streptomyces noursei TaxID=1971 RepID=UPI00344D2F28
MTGVDIPESMIETLESPYLLDEFREFYTRYPTVTAAVEAARAGDDVRMETSEHAHRVIRVLVPDDGEPQVEELVFLSYEYSDVVRCAYLNADRQEQVLGEILHCLREFVGAERTPSKFVVVSQETETIFPRVGLRILTPASVHTWDEYDGATVDVHEELSVVTQSPDYQDEEATLRGSKLAKILAAAGLAVYHCARCGQPLTYRHPIWPGTWISLDEEGPRCESYSEPFHPQHDDWVSVGAPHISEKV